MLTPGYITLRSHSSARCFSQRRDDMGAGMTEVKDVRASQPATLIRRRPGLRIALLSLASLIVAFGAVAAGGFAYAAHPHPAVTRPVPAHAGP
jgi:hypothetical protein